MRDLGKLEIGQTVWVKILKHSNASRFLNSNNIEDWIYEGEIVKVGRKYITVDFSRGERKFNKEDDYRDKFEYGGANYQLYLTKEDIIDEQRTEKLYRRLSREFSSYENNNGFSLGQLQKIEKILNLKEEK